MNLQFSPYGYLEEIRYLTFVTTKCSFFTCKIEKNYLRYLIDAGYTKVSCEEELRFRL